MFLKNNWYVAGFGEELTTTPVARTLLGEPVVMFRTESGEVAALEDRCCHRNLPLSHGKVEGNSLSCGYHGMVYNTTGQCIRVPGQDVIPSGACVMHFPLVEKDGVLWIWMGDADKASPGRIPDYPIHSDPRWAHKGNHYTINCHHELINDNLIDLSHVGYVHGKTIGGTPGAHSEAQISTERRDDGVTVRRFMPGTVPPPTYQRAMNFAGNIDRWMEIRFVPGLIRIYIGVNDAGQGFDEKTQMDKMGMRIFNGITPETENTTHYFWTAAHNFRVTEPEVTNNFYGEISATFEEDRTVVEAQQQRFEQFPGRKNVHIKTDAGGIHARRVITQLIEAERLAEKGNQAPAGPVIRIAQAV